METKNNRLLPFEAEHPGGILGCELEERGIKQIDFAAQIGMLPSHLNALLHGKRPITAEIAHNLEIALGIPATLWLGLQNRYELDLIGIAERDKREAESTEIMSDYDKKINVSSILDRINCEKFFIADRLKALRDIIFGQSPDEVATYNYGRLRCSGNEVADERMVRTWLVMARYRGENIKCENAYVPEKCAEVAQKLRVVFNENRDTIERIKQILDEAGIKFTIEPKFERAPINGCAFIASDGHPCIVMTKRTDQIDSFAFSVLHELGHIMANHTAERDTFLFGKTNAEEDAADKFAATTLIPNTIWRKVPAAKPSTRSFLHTYTRWADDMGINKWIVLGRLEHELNIMGFRSDKTRRIA